MLHGKQNTRACHQRNGVFHGPKRSSSEGLEGYGVRGRRQSDTALEIRMQSFSFILNMTYKKKD